jgi:hypothetical protein
LCRETQQTLAGSGVARISVKSEKEGEAMTESILYNITGLNFCCCGRKIMRPELQKQSALKLLSRTSPPTSLAGAHSGFCPEQDFIRNKKNHATFFCGQLSIDILDRVSYSLNVSNQFLIKNINGGLHER